MSNSYRKTPICGWGTARSEKQWKRHCHKRQRVAERTALAALHDQIPDPTRGEFGPKDGKQYITHDRERWMRK